MSLYGFPKCYPIPTVSPQLQNERPDKFNEIRFLIQQITSLRDAKENLNSEDGAQSSQLRTLKGAKCATFWCNVPRLVLCILWNFAFFWQTCRRKAPNFEQLRSVNCSPQCRMVALKALPKKMCRISSFAKIKGVRVQHFTMICGVRCSTRSDCRLGNAPKNSRKCTVSW